MSSVIEETVVESKKTTADRIAVVCPLSDEARRLLQESQSPNAFLSHLLRRNLYVDALRFVAYKLEKRAAIWWAVLCLWNQERAAPESSSNDAFRAVVRWVRAPNEENRRAAEVASRQAGVNTPVGMLGMAIHFSGGSISLPDCPEVEPDPNATAQQVAAAVVLASKKTGSRKEGETAADAQRRFLVLAAGVENGQLPWDTQQDDTLP